MKEIYIVERRIIDGITEDSDCFVGSSMEKVIIWINDNKDFDDRTYVWYWVVLKSEVDLDNSTELYKIFDWDGNELDEQIINY